MAKCTGKLAHQDVWGRLGQSFVARVEGAVSQSVVVVLHTWVQHFSGVQLLCIIIIIIISG